MHKTLYLTDYIGRLHVSRKEGGRGLASFEDNVDTSIRCLEESIKKDIKVNTNKTRLNI